MSAQANIVAFDGASTPVQHTFVPVENKTENGEQIAVWRENMTALPIEAHLTVTQRKRKLGPLITRCETTVEVPVMEAVAGQNSQGYTAAPKIAYIDKDSYVSFRHARSTPGSGRLARQLLVNVCNAVSTTVAAATTGPVSELHDSRIFSS